MAFLKNAITALDPQPDKKKELTLLLSLLSELCQQKVTEFAASVERELRTAGDGENKTIPVTEILARHTEYRAYISQDAGKIATDVSGAVKKFLSGGSTDIIDGVASLITTGLEAILGAGQAEQQEMSSYYIVVQDYGIVRYDVRIWSRHIEAVGITKAIEHALGIVAFKSSVDVMKITFNTFLIAYGSQLSAMGFSKQEIDKYLVYAETIFEKLRKASGGGGIKTGLLESSSNGPVRMICPGQYVGTLWD